MNHDAGGCKKFLHALVYVEIKEEKMVKGRGGRPLQGATVKQAPLSVRLEQSLRDALDRSAAANGRSLTQEVEARLTGSFAGEEMPDVQGRPFSEILVAEDDFEILQTLADVMRNVSAKMGVPWQEDHQAWSIVSSAVTQLFMLLQPEPGQTSEPQPLPRTPDVEAALADYQKRLAEWEPIARQAKDARLRFIMKAHTGGLSDEEREQAAAARQSVDQLPPRPLPDLPQELLELWEAETRWLRQRDQARRMADLITNELLRSRGLLL
jgi:hypothetical protein